MVLLDKNKSTPKVSQGLHSAKRTSGGVEVPMMNQKDKHGWL